MKFNISKRNLIFWLVVINPLLSLLLDNTKIHYFYLIGPLLFILLFSCLGRRKDFYTIFLVLLTCLGILFSIGLGSKLGKINNQLFNYFDAVLLFCYCSKENNRADFINRLKNNAKFVILTIITVNIVELYCLTFRIGFVSRYNWGGGYFFQGTSQMPHTLAYLMLVTIIMDMACTLVTGKKSLFLLCVIPFYAIFASGARIALAMGLILLIVFLGYILSEKQKNLIFRILKIIPFFLLFFLIFQKKILNSSIFTKIQITSQRGNSTQGRTYIWKDLLYRYAHPPFFFQYLFGQGDDKSYYYNLINPLVNVEVWAHSDIVQILLGKGIIGLLLYLYSYFNYLKSLYRYNKSIDFWFIFLFITIAMLFNGFYSYKDIMLTIPFISVISDLIRSNTNIFRKEYE